TDRSVVGVGDRGHHTFHALVETNLLPVAQRWRATVLEVIESEAVEHDDYGSLQSGIARDLKTTQDVYATSTGERCRGGRQKVSSGSHWWAYCFAVSGGAELPRNIRFPSGNVIFLPTAVAPRS